MKTVLTAPPVSSQSRITAIQVLRAFAALLVAYGHSLHEAATMRGAGSAPPTLFQTWTGAGVDIFFVISGFVMVYASQRLFGAPDGARIFLARRFARIVPLYWLMTTVLLVVMALLPSALASGAPPFSEVVKSYVFIPYARMDQPFMQPVFKLGWTLNYEMFFYAVFAVVILLPMRRAVMAVAMIFIAIAGAGLLFRPVADVLRFWSHPIILEFVWGAVIALAVARGMQLPRGAAWAMMGLGLAGFAAWFLSGLDPHGALRPFVWGLPAALMVAGAAFMLSSTDGPLKRVMVGLGDASYAIYLVHPFIIRLLRLILERTGWAEAVPDAVYMALAMALTLVASLLLYRWFEKPLTRWMQRAFGVASRQGLHTGHPAPSNPAPIDSAPRDSAPRDSAPNAVHR
ncbi:MAG: acyltransferase family protein [Beijerinckiaceae bacterium]